MLLFAAMIDNLFWNESEPSVPLMEIFAGFSFRGELSAKLSDDAPIRSNAIRRIKKEVIGMRCLIILNTFEPA
jgi:hypothetical protein